MIKKLSLLCFTFCFFFVSGCSMLNFDGIRSSDGDPVVESERIVALLNDDIKSNSIGEFEDYFVLDEDTNKMYNGLMEMPDLREELKVHKLREIAGYISEETEEKWFEVFKSKVFGASDYTIDNIRNDGDDIEVSVTMSVPDVSKSVDIKDIDFAKMLMDGYEFDINDIESVKAEFATRKGIEINKIDSIYSVADRDAYMRDIFELFSNEFDTLFSQVFDIIVESSPYKSYRVEYTVEKQLDDTYRITDVDYN